MIAENYLEIPRIYTSIAEIVACLIYMLPLKKRKEGLMLYIYIVFGAGAIVLIQLISGKLPLFLWIPGMLMAVMAMYIYIRSICDISNYDAGFILIRAFILAEFIASVEWQIYYYILYKGVNHSWWLSTLTMLLVFSPIFVFVYLIDARKVFENRKLGISLKELMNTLLIGLATFSISNINFVMDTPFVMKQVGANILYVRTLVDFSGLILLFAQNEQHREIHLYHELKAINSVLHRYYDQYQQSKDSTELINRKYHDLKHQIALIRAEKDPDKRDVYLEEIDHAMRVYESQYDTGNTVIDTILSDKSLYCNEQKINLSCVVNGELLSFMLVMDICSVFGNALDNAIESVEQVSDKDKRIIRVAVFSKNNFLMMRFENYYEQELIFNKGLPITTKSDTNYHGYGIKSIKKTIEKYGGNLTITSDNHWFSMKILIPLVEKE